MVPEGPHEFGFALHPAASGRGPEIMATTEEWGDQPSWKPGADMGTPICTGRAAPFHKIELLLPSHV